MISITYIKDMDIGGNQNISIDFLVVYGGNISSNGKAMSDTVLWDDFTGTVSDGIWMPFGIGKAMSDTILQYEERNSGCPALGTLVSTLRTDSMAALV